MVSDPFHATDPSAGSPVEGETDSGGTKVEDVDPELEPAAPSLARVVPAVVLGWAVPGLGHLFLRRVGRGLLFGGIVLGLFLGGLAIEGKVYRPEAGQPLSYLAALGAAGVGIPYAVVHATGHGGGEVESAYHDYGNTFTLVAGLLNLLIVLDAFDIAVGRR